MFKRRFLFLIFISLLSISSMLGEIINQGQAEAIGRDFIRSKILPSMEMTRGETLSDALELSYTWSKNGKNCFYVYNTGTGGFVIVSADTRTVAPVFGYSTEGEFDYDKLSDNARGWFDKYADMVCALDTLPLSSTNITRSAPGKAVEPLLKDIAWDQGYPYNLMCPNKEGESRSLTGCVATAAAQIMYYHQWPEHGNGIVSNNFDNYQTKIDLSESTYRWDLMEPIYNESSSLSSQEAVALLMRDIGYAIDAVYSPRATSALDTKCAIALFENFDYSAAIAYQYREYYTDLDWDNIVINELDNNRPCLYSGGDHCFVCDGYDEDGYFHFNFGWSGSANGYFLSTVAGGFSEGQSVVSNIMKNGGEEPKLVFRTNSDIYWDEEDKCIKAGTYMVSFIGNDRNNNYGIGLYLENKVTGEIIFPNKPDNGLSDKIFWGWGSYFHNEVPDGEYNIYLGIGDVSKGVWDKVQFHDKEESYVSLTVINGECFYENHFLQQTTDGTIYKDGIFYSLDHTSHTARVTNNGKTGSYHGNITIPNVIEVEGAKYDVVEISEMSFAGSRNLKSVFIPKNIESIGKSAFAASELISIEFESESNLKVIGNSSFYNCGSLKSILLPDGLLKIESGAFISCPLISQINIPGSVENIEKETFDLRYRLKDVTVNWNIPKTFKDAFRWGDSKVNLHVPEGTSELYTALSGWSRFEIIEGGWSEKINISDLWFQLQNYKKIARLTFPDDGHYNFSELHIPETIEYENIVYDVVQIGEKCFYNSEIETIIIPKTVEIIKSEAFIGSDVKKILFDDNSQLREIESLAFGYCSLKEIELPSKLEIIGDNAFWQCDLTYITIPLSVTHIGFSPFPIEKENFKHINVEWTTPQEMGYIEAYDLKRITLHVPKGTGELYSNIKTWSCFNIVEGKYEEIVVNIEGIRYLLKKPALTATVLPPTNEETAYTGDIVLKEEIEFEENKFELIEIGDNAFECDIESSLLSDISSIFIPKTIERIGVCAFRKSPLRIIKVENGSQLKRISKQAFEYCYNLIEFPYCNNLEEIDSYGFFYCYSLKEVHIPESIKNIGFLAFLTNATDVKVYVYWKDPVEFDTHIFVTEEEDNFKDMTLYVPIGTKEKYELVSPWCYFGNIIEIESTNGVDNIGLDKTKINYIKGGIEVVGDYTSLKICDITGKLIKYDHSDGMIYLNRGIYIVNVNGKSIKIVIP